MLFLALALAVGAYGKETTLIAPPRWHDFGYHRASKFFLNMYLGPGFDFNDPEGIAAEKLRAEDDTTTSRDDAILSVFAVNSGAGQIVYNVGLSGLQAYGRPGNGAGEFNHPHGIAVNRAGDLYVADTDNGRVVRLFYRRSGLQYVKAIGGCARPWGVALDSRGLVYVTDYDSSRVLVCDSDGVVQTSWDDLDHPTAIAVIDADAGYNANRDDFVVVIDRQGQRLTRFSRTGEKLGSIEARDIGLANAEFAWCAIDFYGSVYVTDRQNDQIHKFDHELTYLTSFGHTGNQDGEFDSPRGIAIGRRFGQVLIVEAEGGQYYWIGLDAYMVGCFPPVMDKNQPGTTIALYTTEPSDITVDIRDHKNRPVRALYPGWNREDAGDLLVVWDGKDNFGAPVLPGEYTISVTLRPTYGGQRRELKKELSASVRRI